MYGVLNSLDAVEALEVEPSREADNELSQSPLTSGNKIGTPVESVDEHGESLSSVDVEDDTGPLVKVGSATKEIGQVTVLATKVVGSNADGGHSSGALRKSVSNLSGRMDRVQK